VCRIRGIPAARLISVARTLRREGRHAFLREVLISRSAGPVLWTYLLRSLCGSRGRTGDRMIVETILAQPEARQRDSVWEALALAMRKRFPDLLPDALEGESPERFLRVLRELIGPNPHGALAMIESADGAQSGSIQPRDFGRLLTSSDARVREQALRLYGRVLVPQSTPVRSRVG
jgi:hypothetical protein